VSLVLKQNDRLGGERVRERRVRGCADVVGLRVRVWRVEGARLEERRQDAQRRVVHLRHPEFGVIG